MVFCHFSNAVAVLLPCEGVDGCVDGMIVGGVTVVADGARVAAVTRLVKEVEGVSHDVGELVVVLHFRRGLVGGAVVAGGKNAPAGKTPSA